MKVILFLSVLALAVAGETKVVPTLPICSVHDIRLIERVGFFAQDGSAKPSRELIPILENAETEYPHMTPWEFSPVQSDAHPTAGRAKVCPGCDRAVGRRLGRNYPEES